MIFEEVKKNFGFGCMRLPMDGEKVDLAAFSAMIDTFMENGFNYFDTAHVYLNEESELALRECLVRRYPREQFILADKLTSSCFQREEEIRPLFQRQLDACGVEYFDFYLMHALREEYYAKYQRCHAFEIVRQLKQEGQIRHIAISFHDKASTLERILMEHPEIEAVQLQFNYADLDSPSIQSLACYEVCVKYGKPVIVMEPVKGGVLVNLPDEAGQILEALGGGSFASYAIRFCASYPQVFMVLSGMGNMEMMQDNIRTMKNFTPLSSLERDAIDQVRTILKQQNSISCTDCGYCLAGCPKKIAIPRLFACYNTSLRYNDYGSKGYYSSATFDSGKASDCIGCGKCENICPQHLPIRALLKKAAEQFENV